jgi:hypothetical protein
MGISLNLVIYNQSNDKLIEENMKTIRCAEIPQSLLEAITKEFPLKEIPVYYDGKSDKNYIIECFDNNDKIMNYNFMRCYLGHTLINQKIYI